MHLRPYQIDAINRTRLSFKQGKKAPIIIAPTGAGKTVIASSIIDGAQQKGTQTLFLAHRFELVSQASLKLANCGIEHNIIAPPDSVRQIKVAHFKQHGRSFVNHRSPTYVGTVQTKSRRMDQWKRDFGLIIIDECHLSIAPSYKKIAEAYPNALRLGLTATPQRMDGKPMGEMYDDLIQVCQPQQLIDDGFLVPFRFFASENATPDFSNVRTVSGELDQQQVGDIVNKPTITGCAVEHYLKIAKGRPAMVFCATIKHAEAVAAQFRQAGVRAVPVHGGSLDTERRDAIDGLGTGKVDVVCNCQLFIEGLDQTAISCIIWLTRTLSLTKFMQGTGRGARPHEGKNDCIVLDHCGNVMIHGFPSDDREWSLDGRRKRTRKNEEESVAVQRCPTCYALHKPASHCPVCGHAYIAGEKRREIKQVEGDLVEIKRQQQVTRKKEERDCKTLEDFIELGKSRGYKFYRQWAEKRYGFRARRYIPQGDSVTVAGG